MKVKFNNIPYGLAEIFQPNPLRWAICKPISDGEVEQVSTWIKCKDFFNDLTYTIQTGKDFTIYGFNAKNYSPPKKGAPVYFALQHLFPMFYKNMETLNKWLVQEQNVPPIEVEKVDAKSALITVPGYYFERTYQTSLITLLIRLMNNGVEFKTFEDVKKYTFQPQEMNLFNPVKAKGWWFNKFPEAGKKYVWHASKEHNSENPESSYINSLVHNNGVLSWMGSGIQ